MQVAALGQLDVYAGARRDAVHRAARIEAEGDGLWRKALEHHARAARGRRPARARAQARAAALSARASPSSRARRRRAARHRRRACAVARRGVELVVVPATVQGDGAPLELCAALERVVSLGRRRPRDHRPRRRRARGSLGVQRRARRARRRRVSRADHLRGRPRGRRHALRPRRRPPRADAVGRRGSRGARRATEIALRRCGAHRRGCVARDRRRRASRATARRHASRDARAARAAAVAERRRGARSASPAGCTRSARSRRSSAATPWRAAPTARTLDVGRATSRRTMPFDAAAARRRGATRTATSRHAPTRGGANDASSRRWRASRRSSRELESERLELGAGARAVRGGRGAPARRGRRARRRPRRACKRLIEQRRRRLRRSTDLRWLTAVDVAVDFGARPRRDRSRARRRSASATSATLAPPVARRDPLQPAGRGQAAARHPVPRARIERRAAPATRAPLAAAVEVVHAYSLVHDDLPCMDDDDVRRGRPTVHRAFGVPAATAAGLAMVPLAARCARRRGARARARPTTTCGAIVRELMRASGAGGMIGGQLLDLEGEGQPLALDELERIHRAKTGALIAAVGGDRRTRGRRRRRARSTRSRATATAIGLAFQIADDVLDVTATTDQLGKDGRPRPRAAARAPIRRCSGVEGATARAAALVDEALRAPCDAVGLLTAGARRASRASSSTRRAHLS